MEEEELANTLFVDLSARTGPVKHGACGFLYGLGKAEIPSVNTLAPLKPQVAAQKPEGDCSIPLATRSTFQRLIKPLGDAR